jgi:ribosomal-protein-alanine N-acetyltransferase
MTIDRLPIDSLTIERLTIDGLRQAFETERLEMRIVEPRDLIGLIVVHADDDVTRFLPYDTWHTADDANAWYARNRGFHDDGKSRQFVMIERSDGRPIGAVVIFNFDAGNRRAEIGYVLGKRDWGRGLMREALTGFMPHVFDDLELRRVEAHVDPRNLASHKLLLALGFKHEGLLRQRGIIGGEVVDSNVYGLLKSEWQTA